MTTNNGNSFNFHITLLNNFELEFKGKGLLGFLSEVSLFPHKEMKMMPYYNFYSVSYERTVNVIF